MLSVLADRVAPDPREPPGICRGLGEPNIGGWNKTDTFCQGIMALVIFLKVYIYIYMYKYIGLWNVFS